MQGHNCNTVGQEGTAQGTNLTDHKLHQTFYTHRHVCSDIAKHSAAQAAQKGGAHQRLQAGTRQVGLIGPCQAHN